MHVDSHIMQVRLKGWTTHSECSGQRCGAESYLQREYGWVWKRSMSLQWCGDGSLRTAIWEQETIIILFPRTQDCLSNKVTIQCIWLVTRLDSYRSCKLWCCWSPRFEEVISLQVLVSHVNPYSIKLWAHQRLVLSLVTLKGSWLGKWRNGFDSVRPEKIEYGQHL